MIYIRNTMVRTAKSEIYLGNMGSQALATVLSAASLRERIDTTRPPGGRHDQRRSPIVQVTVRDNNVDQALRALKKKLQREGVYRDMKLRRHFEKPSEKKKRERAEAVRRARKLARKRAIREGTSE